MITRWLIFIFIGYPLQLIFMMIYPLAHMYWLFFVKKDTPQRLAEHERIDGSHGKAKRMNGRLLDNLDDHGAFTMYGAIDYEGLALLLDEHGNFLRRKNDKGEDNLRMVSGDVVVSWCFAAVHPYSVNSKYYKHMKWPIQKAAKNYLKYLGTRSYDSRNNGWVSNRCNNFGVNYCPDSDALKIGQPMAGPQFYTNSCLLALASQYHWKYKLAFWLHWIFMGGWYWAFSPVIYTESKPVHYARDIAMKALYVHKFVFGKRWWIDYPMKMITNKMSKNSNDLWDALTYGYLRDDKLPESMNAFFSQKEDATSRYNKNDMSSYLGKAIVMLAEQSRQNNSGISNPKILTRNKIVKRNDLGRIEKSLKLNLQFNFLIF